MKTHENKKWVLARPAYVVEESVVFLDPATGRSTRREPLNGSWRIVESSCGYPAREARLLHAALCRQDYLLAVLELALKQ